MIRNIFVVLTIFGCGILIPVNIVGGQDFYEQWVILRLLKVPLSSSQFHNKTSESLFHSPVYLWPEILGVRCVLISFLRHCVPFCLVKLSSCEGPPKGVFNSHDYKSSLHSRNLLVRSIAIHAEAEF